jgi:adenylate cyclase
MYSFIGRNELNSHNYSASAHSSSISSQSSSTPSNASTVSVNNSLKRLNDSNDLYSHRGHHPLEQIPVEDPLRFMQRGPITNLYSSASSYSSTGERKRSAGPQPGKKQSKEREKSDGSIYYSSDRSRKDNKVSYLPIQSDNKRLSWTESVCALFLLTIGY